ncbi:MurR/RpiR family transcriptional regulator [Neobacillus niacini]|uniref:MurR/RpiR family transcriptional regulator n=1 Tax=Neobacillus niacini TaxID=86668 RepID=UPI001C8E2BE9|nr:MurR/RpiR family transcriptional regulator [Neobacillus niacini]MBY0145732.1 MurR/RpiR family transcriptional regulator [Neobacillus niacini]
MDDLSLNQLIKENFSSLSPGQKKAAEFFVQHVNEAALMTAFQVGRKVGVSETTVIRLAYALGFSGFSQMQEKLRKDWLLSKYPSNEQGTSSMEEVSENQLFSRVVEQEKSILEQILQQLNTKEVWKAADEIIKGDCVYIGGFGSSYSAAYWFYYTLKQMRENVCISTPSGLLLEDISDLTEQSVVVMFSFPRYRKESLKLVKFAQQQGAKIIAITDRQLSPIGQIAKITLTTEEQMDSDYHSIASVITLLEILIAAIQHQDIVSISRRQKKLEQLYADQGLFLE